MLLIETLFSFYRTRVRSLATLVSNSLTHSCLVDLIDVTLVCDYANSKLVEVVTVVDADARKLVDDSLVQLWNLKFAHKTRYLVKIFEV